MHRTSSTTTRRVLYALLALSLSGVTGAASALNIYFDQNATWRYVNATASTTQVVPANWLAADFDDSGWFSGNAPFTSNPANPASTFGSDASFGNAGAPYGGIAPAIPASGTLWSVNYDPFVRIAFDLAAPTALTLWLAVDNGINSMYLNGVQATGSVNAEGQGFRWEHVFDISADYTHAGTNVLAMQLEDHGGSTAFMAVLTSDDTAQNPVFTTNPPPVRDVPEPAGLGLVLAGLAGFRRVRRTRDSAAV
ncbi:MAG: PEP-CTERM sorting domain-containing protein [Gammaproteobacteria bacterium]|nr:PEP-CTERM sorting domain-containing protein [Gammaproteobacteria bacterium]